MFEDWPADTWSNVKFPHLCGPHLVEFGLFVVVPIVVVFDFEGSVDSLFVGETFGVLVVVVVILFKF